MEGRSSVAPEFSNIPCSWGEIVLISRSNYAKSYRTPRNEVTSEDFTSEHAPVINHN